MRMPLIAAATVFISIGVRPALAEIPVGANPYSQLFVNTVRQNPDAWKQLGAEVADLISPKLTGVEVTMSCGRYTELEASYSNGLIQSKEIPGDEALQARLDKLFLLNNAIVNIVEEPCME